MRENGLKPYYVVLRCPVFLRNVESVGDACNIAVSEVSKKVPKFVDIDVEEAVCSCGSAGKRVMVVAGDAFVSVLLGIKVVADSERGAVRVAKSIVRKAFEKTEVAGVRLLCQA